MNKNRFLNFVVIAALVVLLALTTSQAAAADRLVTAGPDGKTASSNPPSGYCSAPGASGSAIHTAYDSKVGAWITRTEGGPTGVDGGLIQLLNDRRTCSQ
jgi:hypothetical protein